MPNTYLGLDLGTSGMKTAVVSGGRIAQLLTVPLPDNLVRQGRITSPDAMAQELRGALRSARITPKACALVLPPETAITRRITVPYMTVEQLKVNLPYEFHDYIKTDKDLHFYDYAVVDVRKDESGAPGELELLAAAIRKETIAEYRAALRKAGLKLSIAVPSCLTYRNLIRQAGARQAEGLPAEFCVVDLGHQAIRIHMYHGAVYETTRVIEYGGAALDALIADTRAVDPHVASGYKLANYEGVQELPVCRDLYGKIALELLRAVNFYEFNTPGSDLGDLYFAGGLTRIGALMELIRSSLESRRIHPIEDLMPPGSGEDAALCAAAVGAALQTEGR